MQATVIVLWSILLDFASRRSTQEAEERKREQRNERKPSHLQKWELFSVVHVYPARRFCVRSALCSKLVEAIRLILWDDSVYLDATITMLHNLFSHRSHFATTIHIISMKLLDVCPHSHFPPFHPSIPYSRPHFASAFLLSLCCECCEFVSVSLLLNALQFLPNHFDSFARSLQLLCSSAYVWLLPNL